MAEHQPSYPEQPGDHKLKYDFERGPSEVEVAAPKTPEEIADEAYREDTRRLVLERRGVNPTKEELDRINAARKEGNWI